MSPIFQYLFALGIGLLTGLLIACGGAWKDTKWEAFSWWTFLRSPLVAGAWGIVLHAWLPNANWLLLGLSCAGGERLSVETWKACWRRMPSKFKQANRDTGWLRERLRKRAR